jgi:5'-phosphate synthase pdxT subunit
VRVGILALQGDVREHAAAIDRTGAQAVLVRNRRSFDGIDALVLPGGESTTMCLLLEKTGLRGPVEEWTRSGRPSLGTCAGLVLLADQVEDGRPDQTPLGGLDITVRRNGHGRQRHSFEATVPSEELGGSFEAVFIRAPRIVSVGPAVTVLGALESGGEVEPVVVQQGSLIGCAFHPELAGDDRLHRRLLELAEDDPS